MQLWYCSVPMSSALRSAHNAGAPHPPNTCTVTDTMPCWEPRSSAGYITALQRKAGILSLCIAGMLHVTVYQLHETLFTASNILIPLWKIYISIYYQYFLIKHAQIIFNLQIFTVCWKYLVLMSLSFWEKIIMYFYDCVSPFYFFLKMTCYN